MASFAERLQQALQAKGMSAAQLSRELNIDEGTISNYKKGKYEPIILNLENGKRVEITGKIDRIDTSTTEDRKILKNYRLQIISQKH